MLRRLAKWFLDAWLEHRWGPRGRGCCTSGCVRCQIWRLSDTVLTDDPAKVEWGIRARMVFPVTGEGVACDVQRMINQHKDFIHLEDGYLYFYPKESRGALSSHHLRIVADYLDEMNAEWDAQVSRMCEESTMSVEL